MEFYPPGTGPDSEAVECVLENGYVGYCRTVHHGVFGFLAPMIFNHRLVIGNRNMIDDAYCYETSYAAQLAIMAWDGKGEPDGWIKHVNSGRYRPRADPALEFIQNA